MTAIVVQMLVRIIVIILTIPTPPWWVEPLMALCAGS